MPTARLPTHRLHQTLAPITALNDEAVVHTGHNGVVITTKDPAKIATATVRLQPTAFTTPPDTETTVGINCPKLTRLLTISNPTAPTTLTLPKSLRRLRTTIGTLTGIHAPVDPSLVLTPSHPPSNSPNPASVTLPADSRPLALALQAATYCAETLTFDTTTDRLTCHAAGDNDAMTVEFATSSHTTNEHAVTATYPIDYLTDLINAIPSDDRRITLTFAPNTPLRIHVPLADDHATLTATIAPRTDERN